jgi:hypothetical protein
MPQVLAPSESGDLALRHADSGASADSAESTGCGWTGARYPLSRTSPVVPSASLGAFLVDGRA